MSLTSVLAVAAVLVVAAVILHRRAGRARWRRLLREVTPARKAALAADDPAKALSPPLLSRRTWHEASPAGPRPGRGWSQPWPRLPGGPLATIAAAGRRPALAAAAAAAAVLGLLVSGPVAAAVLAVYGCTAANLALRAATRRGEARSRAAAIDAVAALAAELRAGLAVGAALADAQRCLAGPAVVGADATVVASRVASAIEVAETSGAPLAEVLDRLDVHLRAADRARASAAAQAAGARASAVLLAAMPVAGAGLGFLVGIDPLAILLGTPLGAACLAAAVTLQLGGLAWAGRISRVEVAL